MERNLHITISPRDEYEFRISVSEPETGEHVSRDFLYIPYAHEGLNEWIGNELYSWIAMMMDAMEDAK